MHHWLEEFSEEINYLIVDVQRRRAYPEVNRHQNEGPPA
jgi:hypothetical protein